MICFLRIVLRISWKWLVSVSWKWCVYESVTSRIAMGQVTVTHTKESLHMYECVRSHVWMRCVCHTYRPTQWIMYIYSQENRSQNCILLIVRYKYIKSCSGDFYSPEPETWSSAQDYAVLSLSKKKSLLLNPVVFLISHDRIGQIEIRKWFELAVYQFWKGIPAGPALKYFTWFIIHRGGQKRDLKVTPVAGLIFETKIERYFLESFFRERNYCPRKMFSGSNARSISSNQVNSWNESRADPRPLGRIHYCPNVFSSLKRRNTPDFECFFLKKRPWKRFSTNVVIRGKLMGTKL